MAKGTKRDFDIEGNIFWILFILLALGTFVFYTITAYQTENLRLFIVSALFAIMILSGIILSRLEAFNGSTWREATLAFTIGFIVWGFIGGGFFSQQSVLTITENTLFATISGELPLVVDFTFNTFLVPISEEIFWFFGLTYALWSIVKIIGKKYSFFDNAWVQMLIVLPILAVSFALFHVGQAGVSIFIISAIIFRLFVSAIVIGDQIFNWFDKINIGVAFALGVHISNNWFAYGFRRGITVMSTEPIILWSVILVFGAILLTSIDTVTKFVVGKTNSLEDGK
jgi:hypothetical protein